MKKREENVLVINHSIHYDSLSSERDYLEDMAKKGWILKELAGAKHTFERAEAKQLYYAVEIFAEGSVFDTHPEGKGMEYVEFCERVGWKFVCSTGQVHVFASEEKGLPEIQTDQNLKLAAIRKSMKLMYVFYPIIMIAAGTVQVGMGLTIGINQMESSVLMFLNMWLWFFLVVYCAGIFVSYLLWLAKAKRAAQDGEVLPERKHIGYKELMIMTAVIGVVHGGLAIVLGILAGSKEGFVIPIIWAGILLLSFAVNKLSKYANEKKIGREANRRIFLLLVPIGSLVMILLLVFGTVFFMIHSMKERKQVFIPAMELQCFGASEEIVERTVSGNNLGSFLLKIRTGIIQARGDKGGVPQVRYTWYLDIYESKIPAIYNRILKNAKEPDGMPRTFDFPSRRECTVKNEELSTDTICVLESEKNGLINIYYYLIYDEDTIVSLRADGEALTKEQLDLIGRYYMQ